MNIDGDIDKVKAWFGSIDVLKVPENIIKNFGAIKTDINTMNADFASGDYDKAGEVSVDLAFLVLSDPRDFPFTEWRLSA